jgi:hypothetical protein
MQQKNLTMLTLFRFHHHLHLLNENYADTVNMNEIK